MSLLVVPGLLAAIALALYSSAKLLKRCSKENDDLLRGVETFASIVMLIIAAMLAVALHAAAIVG